MENILRSQKAVNFDRLCILYRNHKLHFRSKKASKLYLDIVYSLKEVVDTEEQDLLFDIADHHGIRNPIKESIAYDADVH